MESLDCSPGPDLVIDVPGFEDRPGGHHPGCRYERECCRVKGFFENYPRFNSRDPRLRRTANPDLQVPEVHTTVAEVTKTMRYQPVVEDITNDSVDLYSKVNPEEGFAHADGHEDDQHLYSDNAMNLPAVANTSASRRGETSVASLLKKLKSLPGFSLPTSGGGRESFDETAKCDVEKVNSTSLVGENLPGSNLQLSSLPVTRQLFDRNPSRKPSKANNASGHGSSPVKAAHIMRLLRTQTASDGSKRVPRGPGTPPASGGSKRVSRGPHTPTSSSGSKRVPRGPHTPEKDPPCSDGEADLMDESSQLSALDLYTDALEESAKEEERSKIQSAIQSSKALLEAEMQRAGDDLRRQLELKEQEISKMASENKVLRQNISAVVKTARLELKTKQREITSLELRLKNGGNEELLRRVIPYEPYTGKPHRESWASMRRTRDGDNAPDDRQKRRRLTEMAKQGALKVMKDVQDTIAGRVGEDRSGNGSHDSYEVGANRTLSIPGCGPQTYSEGRGKTDEGISNYQVVSSEHYDGQLGHEFDTTGRGLVDSEFNGDRTQEYEHDDGKLCDGTNSSAILAEQVSKDNAEHGRIGWRGYGPDDNRPGSREYSKTDRQSRLQDQDNSKDDRRSRPVDREYPRTDRSRSPYWEHDRQDGVNGVAVEIRRRSMYQKCSPERLRETEKIDSSRRNRTKSHSQERDRRYQRSRSQSGERTARNVLDSRREITPEQRKTGDKVKRRSLSRECSLERSRETDNLVPSRKVRTRSHSQEHKRRYPGSRSQSGEHSARNVTVNRREIPPERRKTRDQKVIRKSKKSISRQKENSHKYSEYEESKQRERDGRVREKRRRSRSREKGSRGGKKTSSHDIYRKGPERRTGEHRSRDHDRERKREKSDKRRRSTENDRTRSTSIDASGKRMTSRDNDYQSDDERRSHSQSDDSKRIRSLMTVVDKAEISKKRVQQDQLEKSEGVDNTAVRPLCEVNDDRFDLVEEYTSDHGVSSCRSVSRGSSRNGGMGEMDNSNSRSLPKENIRSHEETTAAIPSRGSLRIGEREEINDSNSRSPTTKDKESQEETAAAIPSTLDSEELLHCEREKSPSNNDPSSTEVQSSTDSCHTLRTGSIAATPGEKLLMDDEHVEADQYPRSVEGVPITSNSGQDGDHKNVIAVTSPMREATSLRKDEQLDNEPDGIAYPGTKGRSFISLGEPHVPASVDDQQQCRDSEMETFGVNEFDQSSELVLDTVPSSGVIECVGTEKVDQNKNITSSTEDNDSHGAGIFEVDDREPVCSAPYPEQDVSSGGDKLQECGNNKAENPRRKIEDEVPVNKHQAHTHTSLDEMGDGSHPMRKGDLSQAVEKEEQQKCKGEHLIIEHDQSTSSDDSTREETQDSSAESGSNDATSLNRDDNPDNATESLKDTRLPHLWDENKNAIADDAIKPTDVTENQSELASVGQREGDPELTEGRSPTIVHQQEIDDIEMAGAETIMISSTPKKVQTGFPIVYSPPTPVEEGTNSGLPAFSGEDEPLLTDHTTNPQVKQNSVQLTRHTPSSDPAEEDSSEGLSLPAIADVSKDLQKRPTSPVSEQHVVMKEEVDTDEDEIPLVQLIAHECPSQSDERFQADTEPPRTAVMPTTNKLGKSMSLPSSVRNLTSKRKHSSSPLRNKTLKEFQAVIRNMENEHDLRRLSTALKLKIEREHNKKLKRLLWRGRRGKVTKCEKTAENSTSKIDPGEVFDDSVEFVGSNQDSTTLQNCIPHKGKVVQIAIAYHDHGSNKETVQSEARTFPRGESKHHHFTRVETEAEEFARNAEDRITSCSPASGDGNMPRDSEKEEAADKKSGQIESLSITREALDVGQQNRPATSSDTADGGVHHIKGRDRSMDLKMPGGLKVGMRGTITHSDPEGSGQATDLEKMSSRYEANIQNQSAEMKETSEEADESDEDDHVFSCTDGEFDQQQEVLRTDRQQTSDSEETEKMSVDEERSLSCSNRVGDSEGGHHVVTAKDRSGEGLISATYDGSSGPGECVDDGDMFCYPGNKQQQQCSNNIQADQKESIASGGTDGIQDGNTGKPMDHEESVECTHMDAGAVSGDLASEPANVCAMESAEENTNIDKTNSIREKLHNGGNDEKYRDVNGMEIEPVLQEKDGMANLAEKKNGHSGVDSAVQLTTKNGKDEKKPCSVLVEKLSEVSETKCGAGNYPVHCGKDIARTLIIGGNDHNEVNSKTQQVVTNGCNEGKTVSADTTRNVDLPESDYAYGRNRGELTAEEIAHSKFSPDVDQPHVSKNRDRESDIDDEPMQQRSSECGSESSGNYDTNDTSQGDVIVDISCSEECHSTETDEVLIQSETFTGQKQPDPGSNHDERESAACTKGDVTVTGHVGDDEAGEPVRHSNGDHHASESIDSNQSISAGSIHHEEGDHSRDTYCSNSNHSICAGTTHPEVEDHSKDGEQSICAGDIHPDECGHSMDTYCSESIDGNQSICAGTLHPEVGSHPEDTYCSDEDDSDLSSDSEVTSSRESEEVDVCNIEDPETDPHHDQSTRFIIFEEQSDSLISHHPVDAGEMDRLKINDDMEIRPEVHSQTGREESASQPSNSSMGDGPSNHFSTDSAIDDRESNPLRESRQSVESGEEPNSAATEKLPANAETEQQEDYHLVEEDTTSLPDDVDICKPSTPMENRRVTYGGGHTIISCGKPSSKIMRSESITDEEARLALTLAEKSDTLELHVSDSSLIETPEKCKKVLFKQEEFPDGTGHSANLMDRLESLDCRRQNIESSGSIHVIEKRKLLSATRTKTLENSGPSHTVKDLAMSARHPVKERTKARNSYHSMREHCEIEENEVPRKKKPHKKHKTSREHTETVCFARDSVTEKERKRHRRRESRTSVASNRRRRRPESKGSSKSDHSERCSNSNHQLEDDNDLRDIIDSRQRRSSEKLCQALSLLSRREMARLTPKKNSAEQGRREKRRKHRKEEHSRQVVKDGDDGESLEAEKVQVTEDIVEVKVGMADGECVSKNDGGRSDLSEGEIVSDEEDEHERERNIDQSMQRSNDRNDYSEGKRSKSRKRPHSSERERKRARRDHDSYHHRKLTSRR